MGNPTIFCYEANGLFNALLGNNSKYGDTQMIKPIHKALIGLLLLQTHSIVLAEQTFGGAINNIQINNYHSGAAYVFIDGANFNECPTPTNWCAIDFSLPAADQMYSAVLASKMAGKEIRVTSNSCWATNYARCWKIHVDN